MSNGVEKHIGQEFKLVEERLVVQKDSCGGLRIRTSGAIEGNTSD